MVNMMYTYENFINEMETFDSIRRSMVGEKLDHVLRSIIPKKFPVSLKITLGVKSTVNEIKELLTERGFKNCDVENWVSDSRVYFIYTQK